MALLAPWRRPFCYTQFVAIPPHAFVEARFEKIDPVDQPGERLADRVWHGWCSRSTRPPARRRRVSSPRTILPGMPTTVAPGGTSSITTELAPIRALSPTTMGRDLCAGADHHIVAQCRMALAGRPRDAAERDAMIERDVIADDRRFADDHAAPWSMKNARRSSRRDDVDIREESAPSTTHEPPGGAPATPQAMADPVPITACTPDR